MALETKHIDERQRDEFHLCGLLAVSAGPSESGFLTWKTESDDNIAHGTCLCAYENAHTSILGMTGQQFSYLLVGC